MQTDDEAAANPPTNVTPRGDVVSARSRMRTKYGFQRQIEELAALLESETLLMLAVASGPGPVDEHNHGLLGLTDRRLIFVPKTPARRRVLTELAAVRALMWTPGGRHGSLSVLAADASAGYSGLANADGRDLMQTVVRHHPHVKLVGQN